VVDKLVVLKVGLVVPLGQQVVFLGDVRLRVELLLLASDEVSDVEAVEADGQDRRAVTDHHRGEASGIGRGLFGLESLWSDQVTGEVAEAVVSTGTSSKWATH